MWPVGTLVAVVSSVDRTRVRRIARVVEDRGATVLVRTDERIENEVAVEYDLPSFEQEDLVVPTEWLRPITEDQ